MTREISSDPRPQGLVTKKLEQLRLTQMQIISYKRDQ